MKMTRLLALLSRVAILFLGLAPAQMYSQSIQEYLLRAQEFQDAKQYDSAILNLNVVLKQSPLNIPAIVQRGYCELASRDLASAMADFNRAIEIDSNCLDAYYYRSSAHMSLKNVSEAAKDANTLIRKNEFYAGALRLRGRIRSIQGDKQGACADFTTAVEQGDEKARKLLSDYCGNSQGRGESLKIHWPENENWKVANSEKKETFDVIELVRADESLQQWTEIGTMLSIRGVSKANTTTDMMMKILYQQSLNKSADAKLTFLEKDDRAEFPWTMFLIEAPSFTIDPRPESQLWYVVLGRDAVYTNFRAVHQAKVSDEQIRKWSAFFKTATIVYQE